ncbi:MAG: hypothetical protein HZC43_04830 [Nitrosomonadales bacterium]|nr:hypothetical protein [Nitrosomonadales bacterium]
MNQEQGKEIKKVNTPISDAAEATATSGELAEHDLDQVAGAGLASIPVGNFGGEEWDFKPKTTIR